MMRCGIALPPGRRSYALWAGGRGVGYAAIRSQRLCSVLFQNNNDRIPYFDIRYSLFDIRFNIVSSSI